MHTVQLLLRQTTYEREEIERRFHALSHIHNVCVKRMRDQLKFLLRDREYQTWRKEYVTLVKKKEPTADEKRRKKVLSDQMKTRRLELEISKSDLEKYIKVCGARYRKLLSSQQVQAEAARVWKGVEEFLFSDGKEVHFKKFMDFLTISGKSNTNGIKYDPAARTLTWLGLEMQCYLQKKNREYVLESLDHKISYCMLKRQMFSGGWRYYLVIVLDGNAPKKQIEVKNPNPQDTVMGIDPGVSTIAGVSDDTCVLEELAPDADRYEKQIQQILQKMDRSRRISNPEKYNPDGTINRKNKDRWKNSKNYLRLLRKLRVLYRKKSDYIRTSHRTLCNRLLQMASSFLVERMHFKALQRRAKENKRQEQVSEVKKKDGSVVQVQKFKKKKRFGKSLNRRAPSLFLSELKRKVIAMGGSYEEVKTETFKASQYDHSTGECRKVSLATRMKVIDGQEVQRDLYSAFLIRNADLSLEYPDRERCMYEFKHFVEMQRKLIESMKRSGISMKQCFGF